MLRLQRSVRSKARTLAVKPVETIFQVLVFEEEDGEATGLDRRTVLVFDGQRRGEEQFAIAQLVLFECGPGVRLLIALFVIVMEVACKDGDQRVRGEDCGP